MVRDNGKSSGAPEDSGENRSRSGSTKTSSRQPGVRCRQEFHLNRYGRTWGLAPSPSPARSSRAARLTWSRQPRPARREPPASMPHFLFPLFYLVEIRHRQLFQSQLHPPTGADVREHTMRIWQLQGFLKLLPRANSQQAGRGPTNSAADHYS
jgi:hypothetical protein